MELTKKEIRKVFLALLESYPNFERQRQQIKIFWAIESFSAEMIANINKEEKAAYKLLKRFADSLRVKIPEYKEPD